MGQLSQHVFMFLIYCILPIPIPIHVIVSNPFAYCIAESRAGRWDLVVDSVDIVLSLVQLTIYEMLLRSSYRAGLRDMRFSGCRFSPSFS